MDDSDESAHSIYRNNLSSALVNALERRPFRSTVIEFGEQATMTLPSIIHRISMNRIHIISGTVIATISLASYNDNVRSAVRVRT